jgi:hypothetical protein
MRMSILPGEPISSYVRDAELSLEQFMAKLRAGDTAVTSINLSPARRHECSNPPVDASANLRIIHGRQFAA